jgi:hypothetical protein
MPRHGKIAIEPTDCVNKSFRKQRNVKDVCTILLLLRSQEIEQKGRKSMRVERLCHRHVARTETTRPAAVCKHDNGMRPPRNSQCASQPDGRDAHVAIVEAALDSTFAGAIWN